MPAPFISVPIRTIRVRRFGGRADLHLGGARAVGARLDLVQQGAELRHHAVQRQADGAQQVAAHQLAGGAVRQVHPALPVQPDHAGGHAGQHRLGEAAALVDLGVGVHQLGALRRKLPGHAVERARQPGHLVLAADLRHADGEVPGAHPLGGVDQPPDRPGDLVGQHQPGQHGGEQHQQRHQGEDDGEGHLQLGAVLVQPVVFADQPLGALRGGDDLRVHRAVDHQHQLGRGAELDHGADVVVGAAADHRHVAAPRRLDLVVGRAGRRSCR